MSLTAVSPDGSARLAYLDQIRGYAIFGMILVNILGLFECMPWTLKHHHHGFSYADHIAPLFIFVVGMGYRMSFRSAAKAYGLNAARRRAVRRGLILMGLGLVYGGFHLPAAVWDALMDIGASSLLALPFMHLSSLVCIGAAMCYLLLYQMVFTCTGYGDWVMRASINGGPLGPLSWVFILLLGAVAADILRRRTGMRPMLLLLGAGLFFSAAGWMLRMEWGTVKPIWHFSQFGMTAPYPVYASGVCFLSVLAFFLLSEKMNVRLPHLTTLGRNALVVYLLQAVLVLVVRVTVSAAIGAGTALLVFALVYGVCYAVARHLEARGRFIKI